MSILYGNGSSKKVIPLEKFNYNGYRNMVICKLYSVDHKWLPLDKELKALNNFYSNTNYFRLIVPDPVEIKPIKYNGGEIIVIYGSKKFKFLPTADDCEKLRKFLQRQCNSSNVFKNYKVVVKPIKLNKEV